LYRDLLYFYQIDLVKVARKWSRGKGSGTSPRLLLYLVERLPEESEFYAEIAGGREFRPWTNTAYLLAAIANNIQINTMVAGQVPKKDREKFHMIEGPGAPTKKKNAKPRFGDFLASVADATKLPPHLIRK
jgi:hypothetical protein